MRNVKETNIKFSDLVEREGRTFVEIGALEEAQRLGLVKLSAEGAPQGRLLATLTRKGYEQALEDPEVERAVLERAGKNRGILPFRERLLLEVLTAKGLAVAVGPEGRCSIATCRLIGRGARRLQELRS